jgi:cell division protein FtsB
VNSNELIVQQQKEALEELARTTVTLARLRKLLREQHGYEPAALEESAKDLMGELSYAGRRFAARLSVLVALRCGRVNGLQSE